MREPTAAARLLVAEAEAAAARARLTTTIGRLQTRLDPRMLADKARREVTDAGTAAARASADTVRASVDTVRGNPGPIVGAAFAIGLFLLRHRVAALLHRSPRAQSAAMPAVVPAETDEPSAS